MTKTRPRKPANPTPCLCLCGETAQWGPWKRGHVSRAWAVVRMAWYDENHTMDEVNEVGAKFLFTPARIQNYALQRNWWGRGIEKKKRRHRSVTHGVQTQLRRGLTNETETATFVWRRCDFGHRWGGPAHIVIEQQCPLCMEKK